MQSTNPRPVIALARRDATGDAGMELTRAWALIDSLGAFSGIVHLICIPCQHQILRHAGCELLN